MFLHVTDAKYLSDYNVHVSFNDGREGVADLANIFKGKIFEPLQDIAKFSNFIVDDELGTIVWENGADLAPEYIYFQAFKEEPELQNKFQKWGYIS